MSISQVQIKNILELIAKSYLVNGVNPQTNQLHSFMSQYFSLNPAGNPVAFDMDFFAREIISDPEMLNDFMAMLVVNVDTLYEVCANHVDQIMMLNTILRTHLQRLKARRNILEQRIDDYLLGIYNSDGYFHSFSDNFSDGSFVDFSFTSSFLDTDAGVITLPVVSTSSRKINPSSLSDPLIQVTDQDGNSLSFISKSEFINAFDGMTNTAWYFEVRTSEPKTITVNMEIELATSLGSTQVSKIDLVPYGISPVQVGVNAVFIRVDTTRYTNSYSSYVKRSSEKMSFVGDQVSEDIDRLIFQLSKTEYDYVDEPTTNKQYVYLFGFKEILMTEQSYDASSTFVSHPFGMPEDFSDEAVIDAVSVVIEDFVPTSTEIKYYIAEDIDNATSLSDFDWQEIVPLRAGNVQDGNIVRFNGSMNISKMIRKTPRSGNELKLIDFNTTSSDLTKRNPTPAYLPGLDVYRITSFKEEFLANTASLEEGVNTTRIYYIDLDENAVTGGFAFWKAKFDDPTSYFTTYGEIDSGHETFYGADIGEDGKSVYAETFLITEKEYPVFLKECRKSDVNSRLWEVRIFLNGREIANMPVGVDKITVPWKLKQGKNHIVIMANIPIASSSSSSPYIGTINIMSDGNLLDFGIVKLDDWTYVDLYKFQNNQVNDSKVFTIYNGEIISRKKPTNNFRVSFKKSTAAGPSQIRLRADLSRLGQESRATPLFDSYRVRFSYG